MAKPVLLLDVMDTLVHDPFHTEVLEFFGMDMPSLIAVKSEQAWLAFERGELDESALIRRYFSDGRELDLAGLRACMTAAYRFLPGIEALLGELREAGVEMHALSNYPVWWELIEAELGLSRFLDWTFVSCLTGVRKPDPRAYLGPAEALARGPASCVFIDDQAKNCAGAEAVGMNALRFEDAVSLRGALRACGCL
ncbi:Alpha-D-glucose-1-phosphate phosphatase YihX [Enhygromyxa salina]|uniref:Alpha-D-glucose-1-phosphate phosphatase YihX n=1 Tax=Enhygromyxa salina TaxID=215803 RepID=A0A2S9XG14_9BACT|nr:HAD-IA family hydrolase [Enhygromyxa salina]PRP91805.1 Alpha-D-glucose-1-phosphate phosphatase YihX [Enhygromyxa salina]